MKKLIATVLTVAAVLGTSAAFGNESRVAGESLDSGLGGLSANYTGKEFMKQEAYRLYGASGFSDGSEYETLKPANDYSDWPMAL